MVVKLSRTLHGFCALITISFSAASAAPTAEQPLTQREQQLLERIEKLEQRLAALEENAGLAAIQPEQRGAAEPDSPTQTASLKKDEPERTGNRVLGGMTINGYLDTYYSYNFNHPIGRDNLLHAYDVTSNAFSLNQVDLILENAPDIEKGKRWGARLDLQFEQAVSPDSECAGRQASHLQYLCDM